jgi:hypothetical protein
MPSVCFQNQYTPGMIEIGNADNLSFEQRICIEVLQAYKPFRAFVESESRLLPDEHEQMKENRAWAAEVGFGIHAISELFFITP